MNKFRSFIALTLTAFINLSMFFPANAVNQFKFSGSGFGHGVGLSQIGAKAMAMEGKSAEEILKYYFTGVTIEPVTDWYDLRINIGHLLKSAKLQLASSTGFFKINDLQINDRQSVVTFQYSSAGIVTTVNKGKTLVTTLPATNSITIQWSGTRFLEGDSSVISFTAEKSIKYKYGQINLLVVGKSFEATNTVRLKDEYLYGISEVSSSWPMESLRAQAIAARTYAISKAGIYRPSCDCELYGSIKDQLFVGIAKISEAKYGSAWKAAVDSTSVDDENGEAITYMGNPISAYYSSSTGGSTESALNAFDTAVDYLVPVPDPVSLDQKLNPRFANWERSVAATVVAKAFLLPDVEKLVINGKRIEATSSNGAKASLRLETFRSRAGLPSSTFKIII